MKTYLVAALIAAAAFPVGAQESERILSFHADVSVNRDASVDLVETIEVYAGGDQIRRGIYRDVPMRGLKPDRILVDGRESAFHTESYGNGTRIYVGDADTFLSPGFYTYTIAYSVPLEVRFFEDADQVYWNVTGNEWIFPIDKASALVLLPHAIEAESLGVEGWTGAERSTEQDFASEVVEPGQVYFETTAPLRSNEGLAIRVTFPKGLVEQPTAMDLAAANLKQLGFTGVETVALSLIALYLLMVWAMFGKDPGPGRILPTDQPPHGFSPAACRYIKRMGYDQKALTAALVSMATKGYLRIEQDDDGDYIVVRDTAGDSVLSEDEKALGGELFRQSSQVRFTKSNRSIISSATQAFQKALTRQNEKEYFKTNSYYLAPSFGASVIALLAVAVSGSVEDAAATAFLCVWLSIWSLVVVFLAWAAVSAWIEFIRNPSWSGLVGAFMGSMFFGVFGFFEVFAIFALTMVASLGFAITLVSVAVLHAVFYQLMKAPTSLGRRFLDELDGFEMYLDGEDMTRLSGADVEARFDQYLPFAIALGRDAQWTQSFERASQSAVASDQQTRRWYSTSRPITSTAFISGLGTSLTSAVATSSSSSSSSGGGSSGGGGGGGGGGGW